MVKQLLEAGVHFGHQTKRWNPKMNKFIFGEKNGIYIIDLEKTEEALNNALSFLKDITSNGEVVLFIGTKKQAKDVIKEEALRCGMFYMNERWLGGTLTNFSTIKKSIKRLKEIQKMRDEGLLEKLSNKESGQLSKELKKLRYNLEGIIEMGKLPAAIYVVDSKNEEIAVNEANRLGIPVVGLVDTNCDPDKVDYPVPGNDDAIRSIKLVTQLISDAVLTGRKVFMEGKAAEEAKEKEAEAREEAGIKEEEVEGITVDDEEAEKMAKKALRKGKVEEGEPSTKKRRSTKA
ncbi:MAG: 30S ribosomal protein S2 [Omnitrophica WOR_2 bacterium SM23_29]|nr:MAG: 30S ribosomal protein S2 [Omnitrophica WOR_2 bacterium SM23_29]